MRGKITEAMILEWKRKAEAYDALAGTIAFTQSELEAYVELKISAERAVNRSAFHLH